jgi:hypothetical protein
MKKSKKPLTVIGMTDRIDLPELGVYDVDVKIDTGAYTSSIHCSRVKQVKEPDGREALTFTIPGSQLHEKGIHHFKVYDFSLRQVRSSNGHLQMRYVISTQVIIFGRKIRTEFTLADRSRMRYPILLGRKLLKNRFLVDVSKKELSYKQKTSPL